LKWCSLFGPQHARALYTLVLPSLFDTQVSQEFWAGAQLQPLIVKSSRHREFFSSLERRLFVSFSRYLPTRAWLGEAPRRGTQF
jgi:hypothetical protein